MAKMEVEDKSGRGERPQPRSSSFSRSLPATTTTPSSNLMQHSYSTSIAPKQGFHFSLTTHLHVAADVRDTGCAAPTLALRFLLPPSVFADPYELDLYDTAFRYHMSYEPDLERPVGAVSDEDVVLDISAPLPVPPNQARDKDDFSVVVPIHARYGRPNIGQGDVFEDVWLDPPVARIECGQGELLPHFTMPGADCRDRVKTRPTRNPHYSHIGPRLHPPPMTRACTCVFPLEQEVTSE